MRFINKNKSEIYKQIEKNLFNLILVSQKENPYEKSLQIKSIQKEKLLYTRILVQKKKKKKK